jgi:hypothetical protein
MQKLAREKLTAEPKSGLFSETGKRVMNRDKAVIFSADAVAIRG